jgi:tetratricopeptide (TPR) repeat protein
MFRRLSWHPSHEFEIPAAAALAGIPQHEAANALVELGDTHLITEIGHERYRFHDLVRLYAEERAQAEETDAHRAAGVSRLLRYYLHRADAADHLLTRRSSCVPFNHKQIDTDPTVFTDQRQAANWCERERANLMAAIHQASEHGEHTVAWQLPVALWGFFFLRKYWQDWVSALNVGLTSARTIGDRRGEAWVLHSLREAHFSMHRPEDTTDNVRQTLAIFRDIDDHLGIREALSNLGYAHRLHGRPDEALNELTTALTLWRQADDPWGQGWTLHSLGETYLDLGRWDDAARALHESRELFSSIEHRQAEGFALSNLGYVQLGTQQYPTAIEYFQQAMVIHEEVRDQWSAARTLKGLGIAHYHTAKVLLATQYWQQALTICEELNDQPAATKIHALMESLSPTER